MNTSIIRPASNRYIRTYLERLHGAPYVPLHPVLRDTLSETFGIMVYQEDVVNVCAAYAGMPLATADGLRKALSKKRPAKRLAAYAEEFVRGADALGRDRETTMRVWEMILSFAGYSFCKAAKKAFVYLHGHVNVSRKKRHPTGLGRQLTVFRRPLGGNLRSPVMREDPHSRPV